MEELINKIDAFGNSYTIEDLKELYIKQHNTDFLSWVVNFLQAGSKNIEINSALKPGIYAIKKNPF